MAFGKKKTDKEKIDDVLPVEGTEQKKGKFTLSDEEMALAVTALAERPELKVYNDFIIGQRIAEVIQGYNETITDKDDKLPTE